MPYLLLHWWLLSHVLTLLRLLLRLIRIHVWHLLWNRLVIWLWLLLLLFWVCDEWGITWLVRLFMFGMFDWDLLGYVLLRWVVRWLVWNLSYLLWLLWDVDMLGNNRCLMDQCLLLLHGLCNQLLGLLLSPDLWDLLLHITFKFSYLLIGKFVDIKSQLLINLVCRHVSTNDSPDSSEAIWWQAAYLLAKISLLRHCHGTLVPTSFLALQVTNLLLKLCHLSLQMINLSQRLIWGYILEVLVEICWHL